MLGACVQESVYALVTNKHLVSTELFHDHNTSVPGSIILHNNIEGSTASVAIGES